MRLGIKITLTLVIAVAAGASALYGQKLEQFRDRLAIPNAFTGKRVVVVERGEAASMVRSLERARTQSDTVRGYRVTIFFDNSQNARAGAEEARSRFRELYPGIPVYWNYRAPDFKVSVGDCLTNEEAIMLQGQIDRYFPKAFIAHENILLKIFAESIVEH